jgi:hypothetical protein
VTVGLPIARERKKPDDARRTLANSRRDVGLIGLATSSSTSGFQPVYTENLSSGVVVVKSTEDGV